MNKAAGPTKPGVKRGRGRPLTIEENKAKIKVFLSALRRAHFLEVAAAMAGIPKSTVYEWIKRGGRANSGPHRDFLDALRLAEAEGEDKPLQHLNVASQGGDVRASMFILERRHHTRWGKRTFRIEDVAGPAAATGAVVPYQVRIPEPDPLPAPEAKPEPEE